ncbi:MAG TPA: cytochrome b N-terminal domain-containing protein [Pyrinomonadaceae bacterium]|nr:cytochrome b N-terminal domain-containing protein [Pyrinomonadaceae bacterium]
MIEQENRISLLRTTGGVVVVLLCVQFLTGVLLAFYYVPSVDHAYTTVSYVEKVVSSGSWIRSLHHYGSQWLTLFVFVHVIQLFVTRAYLARRIQWIAAVLVLGLVMAAGGTGYSLPWDARAFFSTRVAEGLVGGLPLLGRIARLWLLGGSEISTITLSRFFALHVLLIPAVIIGIVVWRSTRARVCWSNLAPHVIAGGLVFVLLAIWCWKHPAPLGPSVAEAAADYLPRPGSQFLWLYQSLKYLPGGLGSIAGLVLPGIALLVLAVLPWLKSQRLIGTAILSAAVLLIGVMTTASYLSDRRDPQTSKQLARQAAQEETARREPFKPVPISLVANAGTGSAGVGPGEPPVLYDKFCANCHGRHGEGGRQGALRFPPLLDVSAKPRRTVDDIVALLNKPDAYGLQPPMRSFADKLTEPQMREIAEWVVKLKK